MEDFEDCVDGKQVKVKTGEERIVPLNSIFKEKTLPPMVKEHTYELQMEQKVKKMIQDDEKNNGKTKPAT